MGWRLPAPDEPLDTLPDKLPTQTLGWQILEWSLTRFIQPDGPKAGQPYRPTDRQVRFLLHAFEVDDDGRFTYRHLVRRMAKNSGKSPYAAWLACVHLLGPCRFSHFDSHDRPVGIPESMPLIQLAATAESQVANTSRYVRMWTAKGSPLQREYNLDPGKMVIYTPNGGELRVITSSSAAAEGAQPSFIVLDETEHHTPSNGGPVLFETLDRNVAKRSGRILETANAWEPGTGSVAENTWTAYVAQQEERVRARSRILYDAIEAPADTDLADADSLRRALDLVYADCPWVDIDTVMDRVWSPTTPASVSRRYFCNARVADEDSWVAPTEWAALTDASRVVADGEEIVAFFDGSKSSDATALIGCCMSDGHVFALGVWEPDETRDGLVSTADVDLTVTRMFEKYAVLGFFGDVREWESFVKVSWPEKYADRLLIDAVPTGKEPMPIAWDMRANNHAFTLAVELTEAEIRAGEFTHDGDPRVARHVGNAHRRPNKSGISISKESRDSKRKVDAAICVVGARMVRRLVLGSKQWQKRARRARGMVFMK